MQIGLGVLLLLVAIIGYGGFLRRCGRGESLAYGSRPEHGDAHRHQRAVWP
jgi:hypothetical protein